MKQILKIPMRLVSEANVHQHWRKRYERNNRQKKAVQLVWHSMKINAKPPCTITYIRSGPRKLDFDNLVYAFKNISDTVCALIIPGLAPGRADSDPGITIQYSQEIGLYGVRIEIEG